MNVKKQNKSVNWQKKYQKLQKDRKDFISFISHELRSPLTITKGYLSMMLEKGGQKDERILAKVYASNEKAINLIENLVTLDRLSDGELSFQQKNFSLDELLQRVVGDCGLLAEKLDGRIISANWPRITLAGADPEKLELAMRNIFYQLLTRHDRISLRVALKKEGAGAELAVVDESAISRSDSQKIKAAFRGSYQKKDKNELAWQASYKLIKAQGGNLAIREAENNWQVLLSLPLTACLKNRPKF